MAEALKHLIVVIPGMGGSELADPDRKPGVQRVWYSDRGSLMEALADPGRLDIGRTLTPIGLLKDFTVIPWLKSIDGYSKLWTLITNTFDAKIDNGAGHDPVNLDALIVAFSYDFRLGVEHASGCLATMVAARVQHLGENTSVIFVAHSMGGLVARHWVAHHDTAKRCRGLITLGTPYRGAPKALDVLVNGLYWKSKLVGPRSLSRVVQAWPGLHDLVGIADCVTTASGTRLSADAVDNLPRLQEVQRSAAMHRSVRDVWASYQLGTPILKPFAGLGHGTTTGATWDGHTLSPTKKPAGGEPHGDATVPYWSAIPAEWSGPTATMFTTAVGDRHGALSNPAELRSALVALNGGDPGPTRGTSDGRRYLGLDLDDLIGPGETLSAQVMLGDDVTPRQTKIAVRFRDDTGETTALEVAMGNDGGFSTELPADRSGTVEVTVTCTLADDSRLSTTDRVAVMA